MSGRAGLPTGRVHLDLRHHILAELRRIAAAQGGRPPGKQSFAQQTGITGSRWSGIIWLKWSEAVIEAGFEPNAWNQAADRTAMLEELGHLTLILGKVPTWAEIKMHRLRKPEFLSVNAVRSAFPRTADLVDALHDLSREEAFAGLKPLLPPRAKMLDTGDTAYGRESLVYLRKSGAHYKIGRSSNVERRVKEITIALPEEVELVHAIRTDDPAGIEAYWHRRFAERRANGEWFRLSAADMKAFRRRTFQ